MDKYIKYLLCFFIGIILSSMMPRIDGFRIGGYVESSNASTVQFSASATTKPIKFTNDSLKAAVKDYLRNRDDATAKYKGDIGDWDVSRVTSMKELFQGERAFNEDISGWDTGKVTDMNGMFGGANSFNQNINTNTSATRPNSDGGTEIYTAWDVSKVTDMGRMFHYAINFNQDISKWETSKVTDMSEMFKDAHMFQGLPSINTNASASRINSSGELENYTAWDVKSVTNMNSMFMNAMDFNRDLNNWDTSKVTDMEMMFSFTNVFNGNINTNASASRINSSGELENYTAWKTSGVTNMYGMFMNANVFNGNISGWDVSSVTDMRDMFSGARAFKGTGLCKGSLFCKSSNTVNDRPNKICLKPCPCEPWPVCLWGLSPPSPMLAHD